MKALSEYLYYHEPGPPDIKIYCGDSEEIMPLIPNCHMILSDPPYGISYNTMGKSSGRGKLCESVDYEPVHGDDKPFDPKLLLDHPTLVKVLFGANHYANRLPSSASWIIWDKRDGLASNDFADCELAWSDDGRACRIYRHMWNGMLKASEKDKKRVHPTQKPVALMKWILQEYGKPDYTVLDPYLGSGTTLVASKELKMSGIGIEISEAYCLTAKKRLLNTQVPFL